jgi:hypothetical protein
MSWSNLDLCTELTAASEVSPGFLSNHAWLTEYLRPHCRLRRMSWRGSRLRLIQHPAEFASLLILMAERGVKSYLEIGTSTGGSFYTADSYLRVAVPGYQRSVGYDVRAKLRDWDQYRTKFPTAVFRHQGSGSMDLGKEQFDAAFIDARHLEHWVLNDFEKVRRNTRLVAFHDIELQGSTVDRAWRAIKRGHPVHWEFVDQATPPEARCGIGVVEVVGAR